MQRSLSFENLQTPKQTEKSNQQLPSGPYWDDIIIPFQDNLDLQHAKHFRKVVAIHAFPFEDMRHLKFEKRQGSDLSAFVFQKNLKKTYLTSSGAGDSLFVSFLSFYECHPLKIVTHKTKDLISFYKKEYFEDLAPKLADIRKQGFGVTSLMFLGNIYAVQDHLPRFLGMFEAKEPSKSVTLVVSPLQQSSFKSKWRECLPCRFVHFGLDSKFYIEKEEKLENDVCLKRDIVKGINEEKDLLKKLSSQVENGEVSNLHIVWDCEVFASDYFPGLCQFFPFSYSKDEIWEIIHLLSPLVKFADSLTVTNFNPTVEEYRSYNFLSNFLHSLFFQKEK